MHNNVCCEGRFGGFVDFLLLAGISVEVRLFFSTIVQNSRTVVTQSLLIHSPSIYLITECPKSRLSEMIPMFHGNTTLFITICQYGVIMGSYRKF